ncbi:MAG: hypothetical protein H8E13_20570 [Actinobacteria bacterium]|nr:hypothetical protein [Actinomycetota bacterium]
MIRNNERMMDIICLGEALVDFFAVKSGICLGEVGEFRKVPGGAPANVAVGASKMGMKTAFIGRVGDDEFGYFLKNTLVENNVDVSQMQFDTKVRTGLAFIALPTPNTHEFLFYRNPSADMMIDSKEFDEDFIKNTKIFHFCSVTLSSETSRSSNYHAAGIAKSNNIIISYDPNLRLNLWQSVKEAKIRVKEAVPLADVIKINNEELTFITGEEDLKKGTEILLSMGPELCIVTMGPDGCFYSTGKYSGFINAFKVKTVDATGCGDSFVSGVLAGMVENNFDELISSQKKIISVLKFASAAAAITSTKKGVIPALPLKNEVREFISKV